MAGSNRFNALTSSTADTAANEAPANPFASPARSLSWADEKEEEVEADEAAKIAAATSQSEAVKMETDGRQTATKSKHAPCEEVEEDLGSSQGDGKVEELIITLPAETSSEIVEPTSPSTSHSLDDDEDAVGFLARLPIDPTSSFIETFAEAVGTSLSPSPSAQVSDATNRDAQHMVSLKLEDAVETCTSSSLASTPSKKPNQSEKRSKTPVRVQECEAETLRNSDVPAPPPVATTEDPSFDESTPTNPEPAASLNDSWDAFIEATPPVFEPSLATPTLPLDPTFSSPVAPDTKVDVTMSAPVSSGVSIDAGANSSDKSVRHPVVQGTTALRKKKNRTKAQRREAKLRTVGIAVDDGAGESGNNFKSNHDVEKDVSRSDEGEDEDIEIFIDAPTERRKKASGAVRRKAKAEAAAASKVARETVTGRVEPAGALGFKIGGYRIPWFVVLGLSMAQVVVVATVVYLLI